MYIFKRSGSALSAVVACALLTGCGGDGSSEPLSNTPPPAITPTTPVPVESTFPTGLAVASPSDVSTTPVVNLGQVHAMSVAAAHAAVAGNDRFELKSLSALVQQVLSGDTSVDLEDVLNMSRLFSTAGNASCYGPSLAYSNHQDAGGGPGSGTLPGGDLGLWTEYQPGGQPCVAAQLNSRVAGVKAQTMQGLLLMAALRRTVAATTGLSMPAAGATTDLTTQFESLLHGYTSFALWDVHAASISLNSAGTTYSYRIALSNGATGADARLGEVIMEHTPGSSTTSYEGLMHIAGFALSNDAAMGCDDEKDGTTNLFKVAHVSTLRYERSSDDVTFGSRGANYCGHPASTSSTDYGAEVASYTSGGELDPAVAITAGQPRNRGTSKGWVGGFTRFAGDFGIETAAGDFLYAWQAGTGDDKSRMLAVDMSYNATTDVHDMQGFFGFAADISTTDGDLLGMICNWAGPGNNHTPTAAFQSQRASLDATATLFTVPAGGSKIVYAPTTSCSSTTTSYDVNVDNTLAANEGVGTAADLDAPTGSNTVQQEIESRGFALPSLF